MFTGIVEAVGTITEVTPYGTSDTAGVRLVIDAATLGMDDVAVGDSIAVNGACMTVVQKNERGFMVDVSRESLMRTIGLGQPGQVNLEKAMALGDRIGGHLVTGHVDGIALVQRFEPVGESYELVVRVPSELSRYFAYKGSITINGVSLTVNQVVDVKDGTDVTINLIPHTLAVTTLHSLAPQAKVNVEVDLIARYVRRMLGEREI
jgi:riboflavin synthase